MKRIVNGRLWDEDFMYGVASRTFDMVDPVTGETRSYREELKREYVPKPGHTLADTWIQGQYGRKIVEENCDLMRGQFVLKVAQGWSDGVFILLSDGEARAWFEKWRPSDDAGYARVFGEPANPWTGSGEVRLAREADSRAGALKWDKERAEERAKKAEAEIAELKAKLASIAGDAERVCGEA